jgi:RimJ/RimL family protein N-acetyltransferase
MDRACEAKARSRTPTHLCDRIEGPDRLIGGGGIDGHTIGDAEASELGYWLGEPYWGQGYGREAVAAIIDYGFRVLGLEMIQAVTDPGNTASQKVLLACGLTRAAEINLVRPNRGGDAMHMPLFRLSRRGGPSS